MMYRRSKNQSECYNIPRSSWIFSRSSTRIGLPYTSFVIVYCSREPFPDFLTQFMFRISPITLLSAFSQYPYHHKTYDDSLPKSATVFIWSNWPLMPMVSVLFFDLVTLSITNIPTVAKPNAAALLRITGFMLCCSCVSNVSRIVMAKEF